MFCRHTWAPWPFPCFYENTWPGVSAAGSLPAGCARFSRRSRSVWRRDMFLTCYLITRTCVCLRHVVQYRCSSACWEAADSNTKGNSDSRWQLYKIKASAEELNEHFFLLDYKWNVFKHRFFKFTFKNSLFIKNENGFTLQTCFY